MLVVKRNNTTQKYDKNKIRNAISKAYAEIYGDIEQYSNDIDELVYVIDKKIIDHMNVEEIQDIVEDILLYKNTVVGKAYTKYRYKRQIVRNTTDNAVMELLDGKSEYWNTENSNKDARTVTTQRDYIAGITSKDITKRFLLSDDIVKADEEGIIHFHDGDYFVQPISNCFHGSTKFITSDGVRRFDSCYDGELVNVVDKNGEWRQATVHNYGRQKMQTVTLQSGMNAVEIKCTPNHRWILEDGSITTNLKVNDRLFLTPCQHNDENTLSNRNWIVKNIDTTDLHEYTAWCVEEPETHSFTLDGGIVTGNCCLINLEDMLQNGTVINKKMIEKPHKFLTAMTIATQIITAVASSQYGGVTINISHLTPFVRDSYNYYFNKYKKRGFDDGDSKKYAEEDLKKEVEAGVQTFNYQINSMSTTNGQAPFISVFLYLSDNKEYIKETAMVIEEFFNQRIQGIKNEEGVYTTQEFPKLLYVLEENNIREDSEYFHLTRLAAKCNAKRLTPDYISEKKMIEYKNGDVYGCMG